MFIAGVSSLPLYGGEASDQVTVHFVSYCDGAVHERGSVAVHGRQDRRYGGVGRRAEGGEDGLARWVRLVVDGHGARTAGHGERHVPLLLRLDVVDGVNAAG